MSSSDLRSPLATAMVVLNELVADGRRLSDLGQYDIAISKLRDGLESSRDLDKLQLAVELSRVYVTQGYWKRALETLENALEGNPVEICAWVLRVKMEICLLRVIVTASFAGALKQASAIWQEFLDLGYISEQDELFIQSKRSYSRLVVITHNLHEPQPPETEEFAVGWLLPTFQKLITAKREREALNLAGDYIGALSFGSKPKPKSLSLDEWTRMMDDLIRLPSAGKTIKAQAASLLANHLDKNEVNRINHLEKTAVDLFEEVGHTHGAMDISIDQACRSIVLNVNSLTTDLVDELKAKFMKYESLNAISPYAAALEKLMVSVPPWFVFDFRLAIGNLCYEVSQNVDAKLMSLLSRTKIMAIWLTTGGKTARVVETSIAIYAELGEQDCKWLKGQFANLASLAYLQLDDANNAEAWAKNCLSIWGTMSKGDVGLATMILLQAKVQKCGPIQDASEDQVEDLLNFAEAKTILDLENGEISHAVQKMIIIIGQVYIARRDARLGSAIDRLRQQIQAIPEASSEERDLQLAGMYQSIGNSLLSSVPSTKLKEGAAVPDDCVTYYERAIEIFMKYGRLMEAATTRQQHALRLYSLFKIFPMPETLQRCIDLSLIAKEAFDTMGMAKLSCESTLMCSVFIFIAWDKSWLPGSVALNALKEAEEAWGEQRNEFSIFTSLNALAHKQSLNSVTRIRDTYARAFAVCQREGRVIELWDWIQKAKARSLSDILGLGMLIPASLREEVLTNAKLNDLFVRERELINKINSCEHSARITLRTELYAIQKQMVQHTPLKAIIDLRNGSPVSAEQLRSLQKRVVAKASGRRTICIDWIDLMGNIFMLVVSGDEPIPRVENCMLTIDFVEKWKQKWLSGGIEDEEYEEDEPEFCLRQLDSLVLPLRKLSTEDDIIVCCPTGVLHSLPLHALWISDKTPLIVRNPVVYCASLTSFWQCCQRAESSIPDDRPWHLLGVYEQVPSRRFYPRERDAVYTAVSNLALKHSAIASTGSGVTKAHFADVIQQSALLHFHGHCLLDSDMLTEQSLELADGYLLAKEVFDLKLQNPHITLIACESASQGIAAGDDPLGLVTALLCAGASSVVGTIWPTASGTGRLFADVFYTNLERQRDEIAGNSGIFNMADALRSSVIWLRRQKDTRHPYHWASFVLHGSWFMKVPNLKGPSSTDEEKNEV